MSENSSISVEEAHESGQSDNRKMTKTVSILHLVCISFFYVCAGPFGQGEAIAAGGAKWCFVFTLLVPFVLSIPLALISSEQATRLPMCGGCIEWGLILGKFMGYLNCYVRTLCSVFDNAIYPVMFCDYFISWCPELEETKWRIVTVFLINALVIILNVAGLEIVGWYSFILSIVIVAPFLLFFCFGAKFMTVEKVFAEKDVERYGDIDWNLLASTLIWQYCGFDTVAALAEETKNPKVTFPTALSITTIIVTLVYLLPTISGVSVQPDLTQWENDAYADVSLLLPYCENGWLRHWITLAGCLSGISLLNVAISCTGRETYAGGCLGSFPFSKFFAKLNRNMKGELIPICSLCFMSILTIPFTLFDFNMLVEWSGLLSVIQQLLQIAAYIACKFPSCIDRFRRDKALLLARVEQIELDSMDAENEIRKAELEALEDKTEVIDDEEDLKDKFIVPGGWWGVAFTCIPLAAISMFLVVVCGWLSIVISIAMVVGMFLLKGIEIAVVYGIHRVQSNSRKRHLEYSNRSERSASTQASN